MKRKVVAPAKIFKPSIKYDWRVAKIEKNQGNAMLRWKGKFIKHCIFLRTRMDEDKKRRSGKTLE